MKSILYFMNTSWNWIFQRPHILALCLQRDFNTTVVQKVYYKDRYNKKAEVLPNKLISIIQLPFTRRFLIIGRICNWYTKIIVRKYMNTDCLWLTHPEQYIFIPPKYTGIIVYDCMDNHIALSKGKGKKDAIKYEKVLIERADIVFASSKKIYEAINKKEKTYLVRNGVVSTECPYAIKETNLKENYRIGYIGTISQWFNWSLINNTNDLHVTYYLVGPKSKNVDQLVDNCKVVFLGTVNHSELYDAVSECDALIMPFIINDIVLSVDPVKLYEYILFGKCIISVWYPEIERFEPFVYFYKDIKEYESLIKDLSKKGFPVKYSLEQRDAFLKDNSWDERYSIIRDVLVEKELIVEK